MSEKQFPQGIRVEKRENSPSFLIASLGIKVEEFYAWMKEHEKVNGYVNVDIKLSKSGKLYADYNDWQPTTQLKTETRVDEEISPADIPF